MAHSPRALRSVGVAGTGDAIYRTRLKACPDAPPRSRIGAVVFLQHSGSSLNLHIHLHVVATIGVFAAVATPSARSDTPDTPSHSAQTAADAPSVRFHEATELTDANIQTFTDSLTEKVRKRVLRWMVKKNLLDSDDAADMLTWQGHGGFSIDASVHIPAHDRNGLERLLRYCALFRYRNKAHYSDFRIIPTAAELGSYGPFSVGLLMAVTKGYAA